MQKLLLITQEFCYSQLALYLDLADIISLSAMTSAVFQLRKPHAFRVQFCTVAKTLSTQ